MMVAGTGGNAGGSMGAAMTALAACLAATAVPPAGEARAGELPARVHQIVIHVLGHPSYASPERRFVFYEPLRTQALWKSRFGAHWIVWTDGSIWPRHVADGQPRSWTPDPTRGADADVKRRLAAEAAPVYAHVHPGNSTSVGIEIAHSGRGQDPFPPAQVASLAFLLRTLLEMSGGRLDSSAVVGHKDVDRRPAYAQTGCHRPGCPVYVDPSGQPYRRRVDPPESLFQALALAGLAVPRPGGSDVDLKRAESLLPPGQSAGIGH
jgi:N-acetylmuramoyl-L-alanine amidase-like protein